MDFAILATFGAIAAGNYLAWSNVNYKKFFNLFRRASSGQEVIKPAEIKIDKDKDNNVLLECTGIPIVDLVTPEQLAEVEQQIAEANSEKPAEKKAEKQQTKEAATQPKVQLYNIKINTKKRAEDITLAEIYLSNWEENFEVIVTTSEGKVVLPTSDEYRSVVTSLKTLFPSTSPSKEITRDLLISTVEADGGTIAFDNGTDLQFLEHNREFDRALLRAAVEKAKSGDPSFLSSYFEAIEQGNRNSLFNAEKKHLELLEKKKKLEEAQSDIRAKVIKRWTIAAISVIATIFVVAAVITIIVFFPPAGIVPIIGTIVTIVPIVISAVSFIGKVISVLINPAAAIAPDVPTAVAAAGVITTVLGFGRKLWRYLNGSNEKANIKKELEGVNKELEETEGVEKILREGVSKKMRKEGVEEVLKVIDPNIQVQEKADVLKLSDIGPAGLQILFDHLQSNETPRYQRIDLTENSVDEEGKKIILEALSQNFTVTELSGITVTNDVARQLLINGYLQGTISDNDTRIAGLFGNAQTFKTAVITKIKDKNTYEKITSFAEALESLNPTEGKSLKEGVAKRMRDLCKLPYTSTSAVPEFKENLRKAALVSSVMAMGTLGNLKYNPEGTYEELRDEFKKQSAVLKQSGRVIDAEKLDGILNKDFEEDLITRYPLLQESSKKAVVMGTRDRDQKTVQELEKELKSNYSLRSSDFVSKGANPLAKAAVEFVCHRNKLMDALVKPDLESFKENYSLIPADRCENVLEKIVRKEDKLKILQLIVNKDSAEKGIASTCENMHKLDQQGGLVILLERCFSLNDIPSDAHKKAELISALLKIPGLFEQPDDENKKAIKQEIYWATTPHGSGYGYVGKDVPYYNLSGLESRLQKIPESNPYKVKIAEAIQLKVKSPEPGVKDKVSATTREPVVPTVGVVSDKAVKKV